MIKDKRGKTEGSRRTQVKPGEVRNPKGRPKGSKNKKSIIEAAVQTALVDKLEQDAVEIYNKAADMAKQGDRTMIKLFLSRLLPELKAAGEDTSLRGVGGIQIVVNQAAPSEPKEVSGITINQIEGDTDVRTDN